jgi:hypothetical protein
MKPKSKSKKSGKPTKRKPKGTQKNLVFEVRDPKQYFALPVHKWIPKNLPIKPNPDEIVRETEVSYLVRKEKSKPNFGKPSEPPSEIKKWTTQREDEERNRFFEADQESRANLHIRAEVSPDATRYLHIKLENFIKQLLQLAKSGNADAACLLGKTIREACGELNKLALKEPALLRPEAMRSLNWPILDSPHPHLRDDSERILKSLKLGEGTALEIDKSAKWSLKDPAAEYAFCLLNFIHESRRNPSELIGLPAILIDRIKALDKYNDDNAKNWWKVAKDIFLHSYPEPETIPELADLIKTPSHTKSPGRIKQRILEKIQARFISFSKPAYLT